MFKKLARGLIIGRRKKADEKTKGGLHIPERYQSKTLEVLVEKIGNPPVTRMGAEVESELKPGDKVLLNPQATTEEFELDDQEFIAFHEGDVLGLIEEESG